MSLSSGQRELLLGIDVGTTISKCVVFDFEGNEIAAARCPTAVQHPIPASSEIDMRDVWNAVSSSIRELVSKHGISGDSIKALGVCSTVAGVWLLDKNKKPLRNALLWNDGRAAPILANWETEGVMQAIFDISANAIFPGMTLPSLRWLADNEPQTLQEARYLMCGKDWVRFNLTGEIHSDVSDLSQMPCDNRTRYYSDELFRLCGIQDYIHLFPSVVKSHEVIGTVTKAAAEETGLKEGTPVVTGLGDVQASMLGAGAVRPGDACSIVGTSSLNNVVLDYPTFEPSGIGFTFMMGDNLWLRSLTNTSGTINLEWFINNFYTDEKIRAEGLGTNVYQVMEEIASSIPLGSGGIIYHPYLNTTGVSAPFRNAAARAQFFGVEIDHDRRFLLRAVYEGLALAMGELYDLIPAEIPEVIVTGGGARSPFWCQMFADCTGRRMVIPEGTEFGGKGVAMLSGIGIGIYKDFEDARRRTFHMARSHEPDPLKTRQYEKVYSLYRQIYLSMQENWWQRLRLLSDLETS